MLVAAQVIAKSRDFWQQDDKADLRKRVEFVGGDFFNSGAPWPPARLMYCLQQ